MEKITKKLLWLLMLPLAMVLATSCGDDDDDDIGGEAELVGTWSFSDVNFEFTIAGQDLVDWIKDQLELTQAEAEEFLQLFEEIFAEEIEGSITFNADGTFSGDFGGETDSGQWSLNGNKLTITSDDADPGEETQMLTVLTLNASTLVVQFTETEGVDDIDGDGTDDEISFIAEITFSKQ